MVTEVELFESLDRLPLDLFMVLDEERSLQTKIRYMRWTDRSHFGCCWPHRETWRSTQMKDKRSSHMICKVHWGWRWDFKYLFSTVTNLSFLCKKFVV